MNGRFYDIVTKTEAKRRAEREAERQRYLEQKRRRREAKKGLGPALTVEVAQTNQDSRRRLELLRAWEQQVTASTPGCHLVHQEVRAEKARLKHILRS